MRPKIFRAFLQMEEMWGDHEREGVRRTPRYLKDETRSIGRREIVSGGNWLKRGGLAGEKHVLRLGGVEVKKVC